MTHPLVAQLRFTRKEFLRSVKGVSEADAKKRILPMNCLSWNVGHLAWQEQRYFLVFAQGQMPFPQINEAFAYGAPASEPSLKEVLAAWKAITAAADPWLDTLTSTGLQQAVISKGKPTARLYGNLLQRTIYHYWYHTGENMAIRQLLGHERLPQFVGAIDSQAPYRPEQIGQTVTPQLRMTDARRSLPFYVDGLGFAVDWQHQFEPGFPLFIQLTRAGQTIYLTEHAGDCQVGGAAYFVVPDVDACYEAFVAGGVSSIDPPADTPWETREMVVTDPDGNRLRFANPVSPDQ